MSLFYVGHPKETDLALFAGGELGDCNPGA